MKTSIKTVIKKIEPLHSIVFCSILLYAWGITWGLPNSESWLSDTLAPYYPLLGLTRLFSFGYLHKYPLVHQFLLAILNLPVAVLAIVESDFLQGFSIFKLVSTIKSTPYATALILTDRLVTVVMGAGTVYYMYRIGELLFNKRVAVFTALIVVTNPLLNFYSHFAKVEVPYIFWGAVALYYMIRVVKFDTKKDCILTALFACLSFGTKDQGYAIFVLPFILYLVVYPLLFKKDDSLKWNQILFRKNLLVFALCFILFTFITQNIILNWEGFVYRFQILTGWNGQRSVGYTYSISGILALIQDSFSVTLREILKVPFFILVHGGIIVYAVSERKDSRKLFQGLIMLVASVSYYLFFVQIIRQDNARFMMPQSIFCAVYGGYASDWLYAKLKGNIRRAFIALFAIMFLYTMFFTVSVNLNMINDLRYEVEDWMDKNIEDESVIEYYSYLHYLPRFPENTTSYRVKARPLQIEKRNPDYIVITSHYYLRYTAELEARIVNGRVTATQKQLSHLDSEFPEYFRKLFNEELNYELAALFDEGRLWYPKIGYSRVSPSHIMIYKRKDN